MKLIINLQKKDLQLIASLGTENDKECEDLMNSLPEEVNVTDELLKEVYDGDTNNLQIARFTFATIAIGVAKFIEAKEKEKGEKEEQENKGLYYATREAFLKEHNIEIDVTKTKEGYVWSCKHKILGKTETSKKSYSSFSIALAECTDMAWCLVHMYEIREVLVFKCINNESLDNGKISIDVFRKKDEPSPKDTKSMKCTCAIDEIRLKHVVGMPHKEMHVKTKKSYDGEGINKKLERLAKEQKVSKHKQEKHDKGD